MSDLAELVRAFQAGALGSVDDSDDLNAVIEHPLNLANARVCVLLHGILRTPLRR